MNILLISPRSRFLDSDRVFPPLGILYLKGFLDYKGIDSELEDNFDFNDLGRYENFDYFAISSTTPQSGDADLILQKIRTELPGKKIIIGGPHASFYTDDCIPKSYDHIVIGDGEEILYKILANKIRRKIAKGLLTENEMNSLPLPYREKSFLARYSYQLDGLDATTMMTSRGCPFRCAFCEHAKTSPRYYSVNRLKEELSQTIDLGYKAIMFFDDLFAVNQKRVEDLCGAIKEFGIKFRCFGHVRCMTPKMAESLAAAGCVETGVGMESGSQKILNTVKFPTPTIAQSYQYIKICHAAGIRVKAFFILGLPGETIETIKETEEFIKNSGVDDFDLTVYYPYKGTMIRDQLQQYDLFLEESPSMGFYKGQGGSAESIIRTRTLSAEEIRNVKNKIFKSYKKI